MPATKRRFFATAKDRYEAVLKIAKEYGRGKSAFVLADELGVPTNIISGYATILRQKGVDIPRVQSSGLYTEVLKSLAQSHPTLLKAEARRAIRQ